MNTSCAALVSDPNWHWERRLRTHFSNGAERVGSQELPVAAFFFWQGSGYTLRGYFAEDVTSHWVVNRVEEPVLLA